MKTLTHPQFFALPKHSCCTVPVSSTGSLWAGFGGWHYYACSFSISRRSALHKFHYTTSVCQFIPANVDYVGNAFASPTIRSRFLTWSRIDETFINPSRKYSHKQAA